MKGGRQLVLMSGSGDDQQLEGVTTATNTPLLGTSLRAARERPFLPAHETTYGVDQFEGAMGDSTFGNGNGDCEPGLSGVLSPAEIENMKIEIEREDDGRWIAGIPDLPGVMVYGPTRQDALKKVEALALRVIADRLDHGEAIPELDELFAVPA